MTRLLFTIPFLIFSIETFANSPMTIKLGGSLETQFGSLKQKTHYNSLGGDRIHSSALVNSTRITVNADGDSNGIKYGAFVKLFADTSASSSGNTNNADKVWMYAESKFGRLEAGSTKSASNTMVLNSSDIARATGGIDGDASLWFSSKLENGDSVSKFFTLAPGMPTYCNCKSSANKLVYYSPKLNGFQLGASYIVDPDFRGTVYNLSTITTDSGDGFNNVLDLAVRYESSLNNYNYALSVGAETAKSKNGAAHPYTDDLKAIVVGAKVSYKGFSVAGSYGDWFNTGRPKDRLADAKTGARHWTTGISYEHNDFGASLTHMKTVNSNVFTGVPVAKVDQDKNYNTYEIVSLGADYKIAEGLTTYAEINNFKFKRAKSSVNNKGSVVLMGTKLSF